MKTDLVLTMDEYLDMYRDVPKHVNPPERDARHVPITAEGNIDPKSEAHGCRCDRWGHPYPDCRKSQTPGVPSDSSLANK